MRPQPAGAHDGVARLGGRSIFAPYGDHRHARRFRCYSAQAPGRRLAAPAMCGISSAKASASSSIRLMGFSDGRAICSARSSLILRLISLSLRRRIVLLLADLWR